MLDSIFDTLLWTLGAPLLATTTNRKTKPVKKTTKKKIQPTRAKPTSKTTARKSAHKLVKRTPHIAPAKKTPTPHPLKAAPQPTQAKPTANEPIQKPAAPTGRAILLAPENDKFTDTLYPTFRWLSVGGAARYEVVWSEEPNWAQAHPVISIATEAAVPVEKPLRAGVTYYWRVRGGNEGGWGPWSAISSFRVLDEAT